MTDEQTVLPALEHRHTHPVPWQIDFTAPAHAIPGDAKPENANAMIEVLNGR